MEDEEPEVAGIIVAIRVKPLDESTDKFAVEYLPENKIGLSGYDNKVFCYDFVHWSTKSSHDQPYASQIQVYYDVGRPVVNNAIQGFNCTLFAYGQTGSGINIISNI